jgi:hypothetical protein
MNILGAPTKKISTFGEAAHATDPKMTSHNIFGLRRMQIIQNLHIEHSNQS